MKTIRKSYQIHAPVDRVWSCLVEPKMIDGWGGGPAKMSAREGFAFSLWGGDITGRNIEVVPNKKLVQDWHSSDMDAGVNTKVTFELTKNNDKTVLTLVHTDVPNKNFDSVDKGWDEYYLGPLQKLIEE